MQSPTHLKKIFKAFCVFLFFSSGLARAQVTHTMVTRNREINATRYQIDIAIPTPLMNKLITQWGARQQSDVANKIRVELWKVNYIPSKKDPNMIGIMLQTRMNTDISVTQSNDGVGYTMAAAPPGNDYIVLVYCDLPPNATDIQVKGRPYYPNGNNSGFSLKKYSSNAKKILNDPQIAFGIYSLTGPGSLAQLNFGFSEPLANQGGTHTMDFSIGGLVSDAEDLGNDAAKAVEGAAGWVAGLGNQVANTFASLMQMLPQSSETQLAAFLLAHVADVTAIIAAAPKLVIDGVVSSFSNLGNGFMAIVLDGLNIILYANVPHVRTMNQYEYDWANAYMYNGSLPPISRLRITNLMSTDHRACTLPMPDGTIHLNVGDAFSDPIRFAKSYYDYSGQLFIHELAHAWQIGKYGVITSVVKGLTTTLIGLSGNDAYGYASDCNDTWTNYNLEQQASIIDGGYGVLYNNGTFYPKDKGSCHTEYNYIVQQVRGGVPLSKEVIDNIFYRFLNDQYVQTNTGGPSGILIHTNGNKTDGDGYYMAGHQPNTFFYYSTKLKTAAVNWGVIRDKYAATTSKYSNGAFGAEYGYLGWPVNNVTAINGGLFQHFQHGSIYWNPKYGAYVVESAILDAWAKQGWEKGSLGYPISDFISTNSGAPGSNGKYIVAVQNVNEHGGYQKFEGGVINYNGLINSTEIVLNSQLYKHDRQMSAAGGTGTGNGKGQPPPKSGSTVVRPAPGVSQSINPQPLPPKIN